MKLDTFFPIRAIFSLTNTYWQYQQDLDGSIRWNSKFIQHIVIQIVVVQIINLEFLLQRLNWVIFSKNR